MIGMSVRYAVLVCHWKAMAPVEFTETVSIKPVCKPVNTSEIGNEIGEIPKVL